jgi:hypothetical protein
LFVVVAVDLHAQAASGSCDRNVVITGYWPPTNEMLRQFSTNPAQNPDGWQGENWNGHGFNVYAYFPEFPPDGDPFPDTFGSESFIGSEDSDFRVDYQDTSEDFWRIIDQQRPVILITTSWGSNEGWEIEAVEGGHGSASSTPHMDWSSDGNGTTRPEMATIDPRSWDAISTYRAGNQLGSTLPMAEIEAAVAALGITDVAIATDTSGNYLSGFMGLHGVYYSATHAHNVAAGHIHVDGGSVTVSQAETLIETTLDVVLGHFDADSLECSNVPILRLSEEVLDYGEVELGFAFTKAIVVHNDGTADLEVEITLTDPADPDLAQWSDINEITPVIIAPGGPPVVIPQTYEPLTEAAHSIQLNVSSNDETAPDTMALLTGTGVAAIPLDAMLVLDRSGSMVDPAGDRIKIEAMAEAAMLFSDLLRNDDGSGSGDRLGAWRYNHQNSRYLGFDYVSDARKNAIELVELSSAALADSARLRPGGSTGIGGAMQNAAGDLGGPISDRKQVMVLLTDGIENQAPYIMDVLDGIVAGNSNLQIYSVGLGANIEPGKLQAITNMGVGGYHQVTEELADESLYDLETFYFKIFANATGMDLVVDPTHVVDLSSNQPVTVNRARVISSDRSASFLVLDDPAMRAFYDLEFVSPDGQVVNTGSTVGGIPVHISRRGTYSIYRIVFPSVAEASSYVGDWLLRLTPNGKWDGATVKQVFTDSRFGYGGYVNPHQGLVPVGFAAAVASNYSLDVSVAASHYLPGASVRLEASLSDRGWPATRGEIAATVTTPVGNKHTVDLYDDGTHGDVHSADGTWTNSFVQTSDPGSYEFLFRSVGFNARGEMAPREASRYVTLKRLETTPKDPDSWNFIQWLIILLILILLIALLLCCYRTKRPGNLVQ